nr:basic phospholipase A2 Sms-N6-like [Anolis sagrei ordinatus]
MKLHWGMMALVVCGVLETEGSIVEFGKMVKELTNKIAFFEYTSYGCYCGLGGRGQPRDATDRCCFNHDCCYSKLKQCDTTTDKYKFTIKDGTITCGEGTSCEKQICECDKTTAICFKDNLKTYDAKYRFYLDTNCNEKPPSC